MQGFMSLKTKIYVHLWMHTYYSTRDVVDFSIHEYLKATLSPYFCFCLSFLVNIILLFNVYKTSE